MKKVLFVFPAFAVSDSAIETAVLLAKKHGSALAAVYLLESGAATDAFDKLSDIGFIGDRPSAQVSESLMKQQRQSGYEELGRVQIKAMEEGVDFEPLMEEGDPVSTVLSLIESLGAEAVVLVKKKQKAIFKYFSRSVADEVKEKAPCEVVLVQE